MRGKLLMLLLGTWLGLALAGCSEAPETATEVALQSSRREALSADGRFIVVLRPEAKTSRVLSHVKLPSAAATHRFSHVLNGFAARLSASERERLSALPEVAYLEADQRISAVGEVPPGVARIGANANALAAIDGTDQRVDVDIAVLDTGIDLAHADLNVVEERNFINVALNGDDDNGHGTHVAGIAGALDNGAGTVGVAPGARLWAIKVLDNHGNGLLSDILAGIDYVTSNADRIEVVNLSLAGFGFSNAWQLALQNCVARGVAVVAAAGNNGMDVFGEDGVPGGSGDVLPAAFPEVMTVSAMVDTDGIAGGAGPDSASGADDTVAAFSNFSRNNLPNNPVSSPGAKIDVAAPGADVLSTFPGGGYEILSGTSMASPHVAGAVGLFLAAVGRATNAAEVYAVRQAIVDLGESQSLWRATSTLDPDTNHEPLLRPDHFPVLPPTCGNLACEFGESCASCAADCGPCQAVCGNSACETGETCAACAADCGACSWSTLLADDFSTLAAWSETGHGDWNVEGLHSRSGYPSEASSSPAAHSDNCSTVCTLALNQAIDLRGLSAARLTLLRFLDLELDAGEYLNVEGFNGSAWELIAGWAGGGLGDDDRWHAEDIDLGRYLGRSDFRLRLVTKQNSTTEHVHVDDLRIQGTRGGTLPAQCGNATCESGETCASCAADCGPCPAQCGNATCESGESCTTCAADCGACPAQCGDTSCEGGETCATCAADCGACPAECGNTSCESGETCASCAADCGVCPAECGNASCESSETCASCAADCGACPAECGNASCESGETCASCAADCGLCSATQLLFADNFSAGLGFWTETGHGDFNTESLHTAVGYPAGASGSPAVHSDNCSSGCSIALATPIDLSICADASLEFLRFVDSELDTADFLRVEVWDGASWQAVALWSGGAGDDNVWHAEMIDLKAYVGVSNFSVRFVTQQNSTVEHVHVDDVRIVGEECTL